MNSFDKNPLIEIHCVSSKKIEEVLGFNTNKTVKNAVSDLKNALEKGLLPNSMEDEKYFNIKRMRSIKLI